MITASYPITGGDFGAAGYASRGLKERLRRIGVEPGVMRRVMIAAYEAEMNVVIHARRGNLWARLNSGRVDLEVVDEGPGIPDVERALTPGFSTASAEARALGFGAGMGLPNIRRASDEFEISTEAGKGTRLRATIFLKAQEGGDGPHNSVSIAPEACVACLGCLKACPTRALRLGRGRPYILEHLCVDCTACIAACPRQVFGVRDSVSAAPDTDESAVGGDSAGAAPGTQATLVLPRAFLTHFGAEAPPRAVLACLRAVGYGDVRFSEEWEAALRREVRRLADDAQDAEVREARGVRPLIAPVCPAVVNLVETHFPALIPQLAPFLSPVEAAQEALAFGPASLGPATFLVACPAQRSCLEPHARSGRLRVITVGELAARVLPVLTGCAGEVRRLPGTSTLPGTSEPAVETDPRTLRGTLRGTLRVSGINSVMRTLEQAEKGLLSDFQVIEPFACLEGCFGSPLFAADPFVARTRWLASGLARRRDAAALPRRRGYLPRSGARLDPDMGRAIAKLARVEELTRKLPGRDCAACGAPSCGHLAEDVVLRRATIDSCPFRGQGEGG